MTSRRLILDLSILLLVAAVALGVRAWLVAIYVIPSASMMPTLLAGDYLLVARWPFAVRPTLPQRGDIIVFHAPPEGKQDYAKRVIGLPGDRVALAGGRIVIDGKEAPRWRIADLIVPVRPNTPCLGGKEADGCRYRRYREMLPGGAMVDTIDLGPSGGDDVAPVTVPPGRLFVLGDDRDRSADSRFAARTGGGTGLVPVTAVIGRARAILLSVDGSARLREPASWWRALRGERTGLRF